MMTKTRIEAEVKIRVDDFEIVQKKLESMNAKQTNAETQVDLYYNHPCRDFSETDEALRIRKRISTEVGDEIKDEDFPLLEVTFKGPKMDETTKTRTEHSVGVDNYENANAIFHSLGFTKVAEIKKRRIFYTLEGITISLDDVAGLGHFVEFERVVSGQKSSEDAKNEIRKLLEEMGFSMSDSIRESYLELFLSENPA